MKDRLRLVTHASVIADLVSAIRTIEKTKHDTLNGLVVDHCVNALRELSVALRMSIDDISDEASALRFPGPGESFNFEAIEQEELGDQSDQSDDPETWEERITNEMEKEL